MKKTTLWLMICVIGLGVGFLHGTGAFAKTPTEIKIGIMGPFTGPAAETGISMRQGITQAIEEWNAKGGIFIKAAGKKLPVKYVFEDNQSRPEVGVSVGEKMISRDKVNVLYTCFHSSVAMAVMELAPKYGIPVFSSGAVSNAITDKISSNPKRYWSFWKADYMGTAYDKSVAGTLNWLVKEGLYKPKAKTIVFISEDTDWGRVSAKSLSKLLKETGSWKTIAYETVPLGYTDFYPQLTKIKSLAPDVVITHHTSASTGTALVKQFQELGVKSLHFGLYFPLHPEFLRDAGDAANYLVWGPDFIDAENIPGQKVFDDKMRKRWPEIAKRGHANFENAYGYDSVNVILNAINRAQSIDPKAIVKVLPDTDIKGVYGRFVYNVDNHSMKDGSEYIPVPTAQIQNRKNVMIWPKSRALGTFQLPPWLNK